MFRPIDGDGTSSCSIGRLGLENACAVAEPPATPTRPGNTAAAITATASRHHRPPDMFSTNAIAASPSLVRTGQLCVRLQAGCNPYPTRLCGHYSDDVHHEAA